MIEIDGALGEGGGQILRSAVALALVTQTPVRIENIRAGRRKPGVMRQHRTALLAAVEISGGGLVDGAIGDTTLEFHPGAVRAGDYDFRVGTAGSTTLVFQTVLPALLLADGPSTVRLEGGTHNPWSPPFDFLSEALTPLLARMGAKVDLSLERYGFAPAGGGVFTARIEPVRQWTSLQLEERGETRSRTARLVVANLPRSIAQREAKVVRARLGWSEREVEVVELTDVTGPGNIAIASFGSEHVREVFCTFGERGVNAESVARQLGQQVRQYLKHDAPVGPHLADQLMLPMVLAGGGSFVTGPLSRHARTNLEVLARFDVPKLRAEELEDKRVRVRCS
ncbi:MAG: RNA 3'-terminal phosphate cyclase [Planctomycetota bacterium]